MPEDLIAMNDVLQGYGSWAEEMELIPPLSCPKVQLMVMTYKIKFH